jgi:RimJ/RimL family protein N-acetyltransferase
MLFNQLLNISIQSELVSIRAYKKSDFNDLNDSFNVAFFQYFLNDYNGFKEFETEQLNLIKDRRLLFLSLIDNSTNKVFGVTSIYDIDDNNRSVEVGKTWLAKDYQGTGYNLVFKYYLFKTLLEDFKLNRVQLKADAKNLRSVTAMKSIGLNYEGKLLSHKVVKGSRVRDTEMFSMTQNTWQDIKKFMETKLNKKFTDIGW